MASLMDFIMQQVSGRAPVTPTPERQQMFDVLSSYGATAPKAVQERQQMFDVLSSYGAGMPASMSSPIAAPVPRPPSTQLPMLVGQPMPTIPAPMPVAPMPTPRPAAPAAAPMPLPQCSTCALCARRLHAAALGWTELSIEQHAGRNVAAGSDGFWRVPPAECKLGRPRERG
jgi:hypothetical protein